MRRATTTYQPSKDAWRAKVGRPMAVPPHEGLGAVGDMDGAGMEAGTAGGDAARRAGLGRRIIPTRGRQRREDNLVRPRRRVLHDDRGGSILSSSSRSIEGGSARPNSTVPKLY